MTTYLRYARRCAVHLVLCLCAAGCVNEMLLDVQQRKVVVADSGEDPDGPVDAETPTADAQGPDAQPDAGTAPSDAGAPEAGRDASTDAGQEAGPPPLEAGPPPDASPPSDGGRCTHASCVDAGAPPSPCFQCDVTTLVVPADELLCTNGAPQTCWTNPDGSCSMQCPHSKSCTADELNPCDAGEYCFFPKQDCGAATAGFCATAATKECPDVISLVCGCDGVTYKNGCVANQAGTGFTDKLHATCK